MAYQARIHIAELGGTRNTLRRRTWLNAAGQTVRPTGMAETVAFAMDLDSKQAALGGSAI